MADSWKKREKKRERKSLLNYLHIFFSISLLLNLLSKSFRVVNHLLSFLWIPIINFWMIFYLRNLHVFVIFFKVFFLIFTFSVEREKFEKCHFFVRIFSCGNSCMFFFSRYQFFRLLCTFIIVTFFAVTNGFLINNNLQLFSYR